MLERRKFATCEQYSKTDYCNVMGSKRLWNKISYILSNTVSVQSFWHLPYN